jgi:hypothetical protein
LPLVPASPAVPAAAAKQENNDDNDEKRFHSASSGEPSVNQRNVRQRLIVPTPSRQAALSAEHVPRRLVLLAYEARLAAFVRALSSGPGVLYARLLRFVVGRSLDLG